MVPLIITRPTPDLTLATADKLAFVRDLQKRHSGALGFLPAAAIEAYIAGGRVLCSTHNGQDAGYVLGRNALRYDPRIAPITQAAVCMDLQRRNAGLRMVEQWCNAAADDGRQCVQCWCADDLDSRFFWPAAGFHAIARRWPENSRDRSLTLWRRPIPGPLLASWMEQLPPLAGFKASKIGRVISLTNAAEVVRPNAEQLFLFDTLADDGRAFYLT